MHRPRQYYSNKVAFNKSGLTQNQQQEQNSSDESAVKCKPKILPRTKVPQNTQQLVNNNENNIHNSISVMHNQQQILQQQQQAQQLQLKKEQKHYLERERELQMKRTVSQTQQNEQKSTEATQQQPRTSRIPLTAQNFNRISKTATNLLNDIYERHLLNQTTFEHANTIKTMSSPSPAKFHGNGSTSGNYGAMNQHSSRPEADFNFNNLCYQDSAAFHRPTNNNEMNKNIVQWQQQKQFFLDQQQQQKFIIDRNSKLARIVKRPNPEDAKTRNEIISGNSVNKVVNNASESNICSVGSNSVQPQQYLKKSACDKMQTRKYLITSSYNQHQHNSSNEENVYEISCVQPSIIENNVFYDCTSDYGPHHKTFGNKIVSSQSGVGSSVGIGVTRDTNKIVSVRGEPVGGNFYVEEKPANGLSAVLTKDDYESVATTNCEYTNSSKINIMLETAQAMAAAAYFARLVKKMNEKKTTTNIFLFLSLSFFLCFIVWTERK